MKQLFRFLISLILFLQLSVTYGQNVNYILNKVDRYLYTNADSCSMALLQLEPLLENTFSPTQKGTFLLYKGIQMTMTGKIDSARIIFHDGYHQFTKIGDTLRIIDILFQLGELNYNEAAYDSALYYFKKANSLTLIMHNDLYEAKAINCLGKYFHSVGDYNKSIELYDSAYQIACEINNAELMVEIQNKIGKHYETVGMFPNALQFYLKSESMLPKIENRIQCATTYNHLGNIYHQFKEYDKALRFHELAYRERKIMMYQEGEAKSLNNLGEVWLDKGEPDSALNCFSQSYTISIDIRYTKGLIKSTQNLGEVYVKQKSYKKAVACFDEALNISEQISYDKGIVKAYIELANLYFNLHEYDQSSTLAHKGLDIAIQKNLNASIRDFYELLAILSEAQNNYQEALIYFKKFTEYQNEIVNMETNRKVAELESNYRLSEKQRENERLLNENEIKELKLKRKNQLVLFSGILVFALLLIVVIIYNRYLTKMRANKRLSQMNDEIVIQNEKLDQLNQQLNKSVKQQIKLFSIIGHELRNPLWWFRNLIQMLTSQIDQLDTAMVKRSLQSLNDSATNTYHLMDNLMQWSKSQLGNYKIQSEPIDINQLINEALEIFKQYGDAKNITINLNLSADTLLCFADKQMVKTVVRNLLSNAVKFTPEKGVIDIFCLKNNQQINVKIANTGTRVNAALIQNVFNKKEFVNESQTTGSGLGLILCNEFIKANNGNIKVEVLNDNLVEFSFFLPQYVTVAV